MMVMMTHDNPRAMMVVVMTHDNARAMVVVMVMMADADYNLGHLHAVTASRRASSALSAASAFGTGANSSR